MRRFRIFLTLLLSLTVSVAGWASVPSGPLCPRLHQYDVPETSSHTLANHHSAGVVAEHHHEHCGDLSNHGKPCKGDHCACGCGFGACSSASVLLVVSVSTSVAIDLGAQALPYTDQTSVAVIRDNSPLRPPIS